jgi:hypothetical protein
VFANNALIGAIILDINESIDDFIQNSKLADENSEVERGSSSGLKKDAVNMTGISQRRVFH